jgi:putative nucleotidyltransferase with HDIG domain
MPTAQQLLKRFDDSKTLPHVALRLSKLLSDEGSRIREFEDLIKMDPVLVSRLLRMVNSPYYGVRENITSITRAIVFMGLKNLRNLVVVEGLKDAFRENPGKQAFSRERLWLHCVAVSICSQSIVERIFGRRGEDAFLCGILHDIGLIVEDQTASELLAKTWETAASDSRPLPAVEKEIIGTDHCEVGALLAQNWSLPEEVREGIRKHHTVDEKTLPDSMTGIIQLGEYMASKLGYGAMAASEVSLGWSLTEHVRKDIQEYGLLSMDISGQMARARGFYDPQEEGCA